MLANNKDWYTIGGLINETRKPSHLVTKGVQFVYVATSKECIGLLIKEVYTLETKHMRILDEDKIKKIGRG